MNTVRYILPDGEVVEVPEADASHFDAKGWERAEGVDLRTDLECRADEEARASRAEEVPEADAANKPNNKRNTRR